MYKRKRSSLITLAIAGLFSWFSMSMTALGEAGVLVLHVRDVGGRPVSGLEIGVKGDGGSSITTDDGKARIRLANQTRAKSRVSLQIVKSPPQNDFVMVSPWDGRILVPSFENETENFEEIVVVQRGDRVALENGTVLACLASRINAANNSRRTNGEFAPEDPKANLAVVAKQYGLAPEEVDRAIRAWGATVTNPYNAGLAALYERDYPKASTLLADSLREQEKRLESDREETANTAFFLGKSLWQEGKYGESVKAYRRSLELLPNDTGVLASLGCSLTSAGDFNSAETVLRSTLRIDEGEVGKEHPWVASDLENLAVVLLHKDQYAEAERLLERALSIYERELGPTAGGVAACWNDLGLLNQAKGNYPKADEMLRRALAIREALPTPNDSEVAQALSNLGVLLLEEDKYEEAEPLLRRALVISENAMGPRHPEVAVNLANLGQALRGQGNSSGAETLYRRALQIQETTLGQYHPDVAIRLNNIARFV